MDEAVSASGVSRRTIEDWVRSGQVKRERRKGRVFLWVADLAHLTPLTRTELEPELTQEPEVLPSTEGFSGPAPLKVLGERFKENAELQRKILEKVESVEVSLHNLPGDGSGLDEKTLKELSLLGSVFRSLHQQNEKVNQGLEGQGRTLSEISLLLQENQREGEQKDQLVRRVSRWKSSFLVVGVLSLVIVLVGLREHSMQKANWEDDLLESQQQSTALEADVEKKEGELLKQAKEHRDAVAQKEEQHRLREDAIRQAAELSRLEQDESWRQRLEAKESELRAEIVQKEEALEKARLEQATAMSNLRKEQQHLFLQWKEGAETEMDEVRSTLLLLGANTIADPKSISSSVNVDRPDL